MQLASTPTVLTSLSSDGAIDHVRFRLEKSWGENKLERFTNPRLDLTLNTARANEQ